MAHDDGQRGNAFSPYETPLFDHVQAGPSVTTIPPRLAIVKLLQLCDQLEYATVCHSIYLLFDYRDLFN